MAYGTYDKNVLLPCHSNAAQEAAIITEATTGVKFTYDVVEPITVTRFGLKPTITLFYDTMTVQAIVKLKKYITYGSSSGAVTLATITIDDPAVTGNNAWLAGHIYYVDVENALNAACVDAGMQLVVEVTTAGVGSTSSGAWLPYIMFNPRAEVEANQSAMHNITA
jgi:hypothetical protein